MKWTEPNFSRPNITCLPKIMLCLWALAGPGVGGYIISTKLPMQNIMWYQKGAISNFSAPNCQLLPMVSNCPFLPMVSNCPRCQIVRFYPWCQIVRCQIVRGVKLSAVSNCPVSNCPVSNCPRCQIVRGVKLSWCQIVPQPIKVLMPFSISLPPPFLQKINWPLG